MCVDHRISNDANSAGRNGSDCSEKTAGERRHPASLLKCYIDPALHDPAQFHPSWKLHDATGHADWEADITADAIDGVWTRSAVTHKIHRVRSDLSSWQGRYAAFPFRSARRRGHFRAAANNSGMTTTAEESINGYPAKIYTVDTTHVPSEDAAAFKMTLGEKGFLTGTAWVDNTSRVVKFSIDEAWQYGNGSLGKKYLDVSITKKGQSDSR